MRVDLCFGLAGYLLDMSSLYGNIFRQLANRFVSFMRII